jgi:hypothetical protein
MEFYIDYYILYRCDLKWYTLPDNETVFLKLV